MTFLFLIASCVVIIDRLTKYLVFNNLSQNQSIEIIPRAFHLTLVLNTGAAFGLLKNFGLFFTACSVLVILLIFIYAWTGKRIDPVSYLALGLILGGAVGNLIDRLIFGYVVDFLDFRVWPVFNIADSAITVGSILLAIKFFFGKKCSTT